MILAGAIFLVNSLQLALTQPIDPLLIAIREFLISFGVGMFGVDLWVSLAAIIALHIYRRRIQNTAAKEGLELIFRPRGPPAFKLFGYIALANLIIFIIGSTLTLLGILPISLPEEVLLNITLITILVLFVGIWPPLIIVGIRISIQTYREALREARSAK